MLLRLRLTFFVAIVKMCLLFVGVLLEVSAGFVERVVVRPIIQPIFGVARY